MSLPALTKVLAKLVAAAVSAVAVVSLNCIAMADTVMNVAQRAIAADMAANLVIMANVQRHIIRKKIVIMPVRNGHAAPVAVAAAVAAVAQMTSILAKDILTAADIVTVEVTIVAIIAVTVHRQTTASINAVAPVRAIINR